MIYAWDLGVVKMNRTHHCAEHELNNLLYLLRRVQVIDNDSLSVCINHSVNDPDIYIVDNGSKIYIMPTDAQWVHHLEEFQSSYWVNFIPVVAINQAVKQTFVILFPYVWC